MRSLFKSLIGMLGLAAMSAAAPASATDFILNFANNPGTNVTNSTRDYSFTSQGQTLQVRVSAWTYRNGTIYNSKLGVYDKGFGVTSDFENGNNNTHTIDNQDGYDFVLFQFDSKVQMTSVTTTPFDLPYTVNSKIYYSKDSDLSYGWGNVSTAWNQSLPYDNQSGSALGTILTQTVIDGGNAASTRAVSGNAANLWLVGASLTETGKGYDAFKLTGATVTASVPEPGTWMMMIVGFGMVGAAARRRKSGTGLAAAAA